MEWLQLGPWEQLGKNDSYSQMHFENETEEGSKGKYDAQKEGGVI